MPSLLIDSKIKKASSSALKAKCILRRATLSCLFALPFIGSDFFRQPFSIAKSILFLGCGVLAWSALATSKKKSSHLRLAILTALLIAAVTLGIGLLNSSVSETWFVLSERLSWLGVFFFLLQEAKLNEKKIFFFTLNIAVMVNAFLMEMRGVSVRYDLNFIPNILLVGGTFGHPTAASDFLILALPIGLLFFLNRSRFLTSLSYFYFFFAALGIAASLSRSAYISAGVFTLGLAIFFKGRCAKYWCLLLTAGLIFGYVTRFQVKPSETKSSELHASNLMTEKKHSTKIRDLLLHASVDILKDQPTGIGFGTFTFLSRRYANFQNAKIGEEELATHPHSEIMRLLIENGLITCCLSLFLLYISLVRFRWLRFRTDDPLAKKLLFLSAATYTPQILFQGSLLFPTSLFMLAFLGAHIFEVRDFQFDLLERAKFLKFGTVAAILALVALTSYREFYGELLFARAKRSNSPGEMVFHAEKSCDVNPRLWQSCLFWGQALTLDQRARESLPVYVDLLQQHPFHFPALKELTLLLAQSEQCDMACPLASIVNDVLCSEQKIPNCTCANNQSLEKWSVLPWISHLENRPKQVCFKG